LDATFCVARDIGVAGCPTAVHLSHYCTHAVLHAADLGWSGLEHLPEQLSALSALAELEAGGSHFEAAGALEPLRALRRLTRLGLARCRISALPEQLSALRALRDLDIASNGLAGEGAMRPLQALLGLTRLDARRCGLARLPAEVSALQALEEMDLSLNPLSGESSLEGLQRLTALRHLSLYECDLSRLPPEVSTLPALDTLRLSGNRALGKEGAGLLGLLRGLGALTYLDLAGCGMQGHHSQLSALSGMGVNVRC
jgi:Leucine-rich repeat (LRR) protein